MSRPKLAKASGVPYPTLAGIENDDQGSSTRLHAIAKALRARVEYLETGRGQWDADIADASVRIARSTAIDGDILRQAIVNAEQWISAHGIANRITPADRAEVIMATYDGLREGIGIAQVERFVDGTLRAIIRGMKVS